MLYDLLLVLASAALVLSPCFIDAWKYRDLRLPRTQRHRTSAMRMTS